MASLLEYAAAMDAFVREFAFLTRSVRRQIDSGQAADQELEYIVTGYRDLLARMVQFRKSVDEADWNDLYEGSGDDLGTSLEFWTSERTVRRRVTLFMARIREAAALAEQLRKRRPDNITLGRGDDTYQSVALREYGNWQSWAELADANRDTAPGTSVAGTTITVPPRGRTR